MSPWENVRIIRSSNENVAKYVFSKESDRAAVAESVLYKYPTYRERTVICCSTQSGCPIGCRFCGTGENFVRSLTVEEIVSQPVRLLEDTRVDPSKMDRLQIMFMSMGEPLMNLKALIPAMRVLYEKFPKAALLISTSAPKADYTAVRAISYEIPTIGLQFSVHESTNERRNALIPFAAKLTLEEIRDEGFVWFQKTGRQPFFNYCASADNSSEEDADRILALFDPSVWQATISVICERDEGVAASNERQRELAFDFQQRLARHGYSTRMFDPAGADDIGGGCGQLHFVQEWMRKHPGVARPTVGFGLPVVHTPRMTA